MKFIFPLENFDWSRNISQLFAVNADYYWENFRLPNGHNGIDVTAPGPKHGYGTKILSVCSGNILKTSFDTSPLNTKGNGIYILNDEKTLEIVYWHGSTLLRESGHIEQGESIMLMGNSGKVSSSFSDAWAGTHLHLAFRDRLTGEWLDPVPFLFNKGDKLPVFWPTSLRKGSSSDYVSWLQTCLKLEGFAQDYEPIGYFGPKTKRDVKNLQLKYGIPTSFFSRGIFGPKTRRTLKKYSLYYN